ncbi:transposase [Leptospira weilii]|uniref:transposase n=1 Tax=Leptospira weilii TaxID=28184 RepID=UPI00256EA480|nr:transposase [Leptospira weilii]MDL5246452.1 transposase [Leptospira weilii]
MKNYGIQGSVTIRGWIKKYGKNHLIGKIVRVETENELSRLKEAEKRIRELEKALSNVTIENVLYKSLVKVAEGDLKIDLKKLWSFCIKETGRTLGKLNIKINT